MARARNIKPGFFKNEDLAECSPWARLCFAGLWTLADRDGRLEDRPKRIKGELFAYDSVEVDPLLVELEGRGFLERYRNEDGSFIQISKFLVHQTPHYSEKPSVIKPPRLQESDCDDDIKNPRGLQEDSKKTGPIKRGSQPPDSLNPDSPNPESVKKPSDPDGSGVPPQISGGVEPKALTAKDRVWLLGPPLLGDTPTTRALLGKLAKTYTDEVLARVLAEATADRPIEPKAWIVAACSAAPKANGHAQPDMLADPTPDWATRAGFDSRFLAENAGCGPGNAHKFSAGRRTAA